MSGVPQVSFVVSAVVLRDDAGRVLTVRKSGTDMFMLPGGKLEPGETAMRSAVREIQEEVGVDLDPNALTPLGSWVSPAANEPGEFIHATVFVYSRTVCDAHPAAEIADCQWLDVAAAAERDDLAPLLVTFVVPRLAAPA